LVVVVEDITEQRAIEAKLIQSEKLAAVGTLVSGVAHELNNPLTSIAGLSEFLLEQPAPGEHDREHLRVINEQAERASRIVRNLLTFARKASPETTTVDLADVVRRTLLLMRYELSLHDVEVVLEVDPPDQSPAVLGDRDQLQQVVLNLLSNAAHAVSALPPGRPARIEVAVFAEAACVTLRVRDTGPGLAPAVRDQLFNPFFTTKAPGEGTGLGLFICYGIAETHGGSLSGDNAKDGPGAVFTLSLPKAPDGARASEPGPHPRESAPPVPRGRRILLVDADPSVGRLVTALFGRDGHQVDAAQDPAHALSLAAECHYDLIVADRRAATDRGEPFTAALWRLRPEWQARTIVSTSDLRFAMDEAADPPPPARWLPKPFNLRDLRDAATAVWEAGAFGNPLEPR
jgi:two-component system NtrC family sensor kinase